MEGGGGSAVLEEVSINKPAAAGGGQRKIVDADGGPSFPLQFHPQRPYAHHNSKQILALLSSDVLLVCFFCHALIS